MLLSKHSYKFEETWRAQLENVKLSMEVVLQQRIMVCATTKNYGVKQNKKIMSMRQ